MIRNLIIIFIVTCSIGGIGANYSPDRLFLDAKKNSVKNLKTRSLRQLKVLEESGFKSDQVQMQMARVYFEKGQLNNAIFHYKQVPKNSDLWLEAVEETAWTYLRAGQHSESLEQIMTLLSPVFDQYVNSEAYYLAAANYFYICDYENVFKVIRQFKKRYMARINALEALAEEKNSSSMKAVVALARKGNVNFQSTAQFAVALPSYHYRDTKLKRLYSILANKKSSSQQTQRAEKLIGRRFARLSSKELDQIKKDIDKMLVVEAEVIQRVFERNDKPQPPQQKLAKLDGKKYLSFPVVDSEIWIDELNSFEAKSSVCPTRSEKGGNQ